MLLVKIYVHYLTSVLCVTKVKRISVSTGVHLPVAYMYDRLATAYVLGAMKKEKDGKINPPGSTTL